MKIRSLIAGMADGIDGAYRVLDREFDASIPKDAAIHSATDTYYSDEQNRWGHPPGALIIRVVLYTTQ